VNRHLRLVPSAAAIGLGLVLLTPAVASAHIEPDVSEVPAGESATVAFNLEHGCDGAATTQLEFQVPEDVTDAQPVDKDGWTASEADGVITFSGGSQPDEPTDFSITFTAPDQPGAELRFPIIQTCGDVEVAWIDPSEDDELPAPVVLVGEAGSAPVTAGEHEDGGDEETTAPPATTSSEDTGDTGASEDDDSVVPFILGGIAAVAVVGGVVYAIRRRRPS
jgi:periplasmic copper chaperone A